jgi:hypothetical protein
MVIVGLTQIVQKFGKTSEPRTISYAVIVSLFVTVSPAALSLLSR